ncbi:MAG TPA: BamA/TamA family outer membrane protein, partial [Geobacterales bacterium]|nr:BamA/TamA family outer membrane protein [Geobacterales bacterium]
AYLNKHGGNCPAAGFNYQCNLVDDSDAIRASVGASLIWNSPIGPLRADFGYAILKEAFDQTQVFRFGAATKF